MTDSTRREGWRDPQGPSSPISRPEPISYHPPILDDFKPADEEVRLIFPKAVISIKGEADLDYRSVGIALSGISKGSLASLTGNGSVTSTPNPAGVLKEKLHGMHKERVDTGSLIKKRAPQIKSINPDDYLLRQTQALVNSGAMTPVFDYLLKVEEEELHKDREDFDYQSLTTEEVEERIKQNVYDTMMCLGLDPAADPEIADTPRRVFEMWREFNQGMSTHELYDILGPIFKSPRNATGGVVSQHGIPYRGLCAHHWAPYFGTCSIGYLPNERVVGLSKLTRLVQAIGTLRPSNQEETTNMIADVLHDGAKTKGVIVVTRALHTCMCVRGVNAPNVYTTVSAVRDNFIHNPSLKSEFLALYQAQP